MITIIAGSRSILDFSLLEKAIKESEFKITKIISGGAKGADQLGITYARQNNIPLEIMLPKWIYGKQAGMERNIQMAMAAEACIVIWDGYSSGTKHMIETANKFNLKTFIMKRT